MESASPMDRVVMTLERHGFRVTQAQTGADAAAAFLSTLPAGCSVGIGGSVTVQELNLPEQLQKKGHEVFWHWTVPPEDRPTVQRKAMQADHYICSVNALTQDGRLVQIDGSGNRIGALCFGPRHVSLFIGKNKLCASGLLAATTRIKQIACPKNARRLGLHTPCTKSGSCDEEHCESSICRGLLAMDRPFLGQTVHLYLIAEDLGY